MYHSTTADVVLCHRGRPFASFGKQGTRSHLRLGRLLICTGPQVTGAPRFDPCSLGVVYADRYTADALVAWAVQHHDCRGSLPRPGPPSGVRLESLVGIYRDSELKVAAGGVMVRTGRDRGVAFGIVGQPVPALSWWRPRMLVARGRWVLAGRPDTPPTTPGETFVHMDGAGNVVAEHLA